MKFLKVFLIIYYTQQCHTIENQIVKSLINNLEIKNCIIVDDNIRSIETSKNVKYFAKENIYTTFMDLKLLLDYLGVGHYKNVKTAIFIKTNGMIHVFQYYFPNFNLDFVMSRFTWIIFDKMADSLVYQLGKLYIPYNCEFIIIRKPFDDEYFEINDLYNIGLVNSSLKERHIIGFWNEEKLKMTSLTREMRRFNMNRQTVLMETTFADICELEHDCYHAEILIEIGKIMNSTVRFIVADTKINGGFPVTAGNTRSVVYDINFFYPYMLGPTFVLHGYFHIKDDVGEEYDFSFYMAPFSKRAWIEMFVVLVISSIAVFFIENWKRCTKYPAKEIFSTPDALWRPVETFCNQCGSGIPPKTSSRLAWISVRVAASVLIPAYSATVISYITISIPKLPFTDLKSFLEDGTYKTSGMREIYSQAFFSASSDPINKEITEKLLLPNTPYTNLEGIQWMCKSGFKYSFVTYDNEIFQLPNHVCKILKIPKPIFSVATGFMMRTESPYRGIYTRNLYRFYSSGVLYRMRKKVLGKMPDVYKEEYEPLTFYRTGPLLYVLAVGFSLSFPILFLEMFWNKQKRQN